MMVFAHAYLALIPPHLWQWTGLKKLTESPSFKPGGKCVRKIYSRLLNTLTNICAALELTMQEEQRNEYGAWRWYGAVHLVTACFVQLSSKKSSNPNLSIHIGNSDFQLYLRY
jgi:hypothetical protein